MRPLGRVNIFFALLFVVMPLSSGSTALADAPLFSLGPLHWHAQGFMAALLAFCKGNAMTVFFLILPGTFAFSLNCKALLELGVPVKLVTLIQLVARHGVSFAREFEAMWAAARLRGFAPRFSARDFRSIAWLTGMLFVRCYDKSLRTEQAMRLRGFTGALPLLPPPENAAPGAGVALLCASGLFSVALVCANYTLS